MLFEPPIGDAGWLVFSPLDHAVERRFLGTLAIAEPDVLSASVDLILELVVDRQVKPRDVVNLNHFADKVGAVAIYAIVALVAILRHE